MLLLARLFALLSSPLDLGLILIPAGLLLARCRWRGTGRCLVAFGLFWLLLWSLPESSFWLQSGLERRFAQRVASDYPRVDAIVVLGGGIEGDRHGWRIGPHLLPAADRIWFAARLFRAGRAPLMILSGGASEWSASAQPEAQAMATFLDALGVPQSALLLEEHSRNTWENGYFTNVLMHQHGIHRILLVTSALHMARAVAVFHKLGIDAVPAPTDFEALPPRGPWLLRWTPDVNALDGSSRAIKEYLGLWIYRLRGMAD